MSSSMEWITGRFAKNLKDEHKNVDDIKRQHSFSYNLDVNRKLHSDEKAILFIWNSLFILMYVVSCCWDRSGVSKNTKNSRIYIFVSVNNDVVAVTRQKNSDGMWSNDNNDILLDFLFNLFLMHWFFLCNSIVH